MAVHTKLSVRSLNIYSIFVRNFTPAGTFNAIHSELDRIKYLGTDYIWFLPFYEIGEQNKKGSVGSPFAVKNHRKIDPINGTLEEFNLLAQEIRKRNMKVMIDIVFDHTSLDSNLIKEKPDWYYRNLDGTLGNRFGEWEDIVDFDYSNRELWDYQIDTLKYWAQYVDGFRCLSAPLVPLDFWLKAREEVTKVNPNILWLADTIEKRNLQYLRSFQIDVHSDAELYQAFDLVDDFDTRDEFHDYLNGRIPVSKFVDAINVQDTIFPWNYAKLRFLENHNQDRITNYLNDIDNLLQWTAFSYLLKGATLLCAGQEVASNQSWNIFEKEPIDWKTGIDLSHYISRLSELQKEYVPVINTAYHLAPYDDKDTVVIYYTDDVAKRVGVFNLKHHDGKVYVDLPDGIYSNQINSKEIRIKHNEISLTDTPAFIVVE